MLIGIFCKLFGGTAGTTPTTELKKASEVKLACTKGEVDSTNRGNAGNKTYKGGLKDYSLSFNYEYNPAEEGFQVLQEAFINDQPIALFCADDQGNGLDGDWELFSFDIDQPNEDIVKVSVTAKPTFIDGKNGRNPAWVKKGQQ